MFIKNYIIIFITVSLLIGCLTNEAMYYGSHTLLPNTDKNMNNAGFWISMIKNPDEIILNKKDIDDYNLKNIEINKTIKDIKNYNEIFSGIDLKKQIELFYESIIKQKLFFADGKIPKKTFYNDIYKNINIQSIKDDITVKYAFTIKNTNQRALPSEKLLNDVKKEIFFDSLQMSELDIGTPLIILHETLDNNWYFVHSDISDGWVKKNDVAECSKIEFEKYNGINNFAVITNAKAPVFLNEGLTEYHDYARMGVKFPIEEYKNANIICALLPFHDKDGNFIIKKIYINKSDANIGYLEYTQRNILNQAFKLLNAPYGWGGMFGEQDCSKFLCEVFQTVGIILPRNSNWQAKSGSITASFNEDVNDADKIKIINENSIQGVTLLKLKGHIMLYIGKVNNNPYVIHTTWAYKQNNYGAEIIRLINKTTVSDLTLGNGTKAGSLLKRVNIILDIK